ncbi:MAG: hypothetical protein GF383_14095 [Candidatus Lokiarchaeota archaeon]|nr:hypothetical protein [Candidatus Lokiarchaeota archaeon]MBD3342471.1 hypothetical protein [Candidatus Lokiarchaeota archaeon]
MALSDLTQIEFVYGGLSFLFVVISILMGLRILLKYFEYKRVEMITIGLAWILMTSGWWRITFNFPLVILFGLEVPHVLGIILDSIFIPIAVLCWMYSFSVLVYPNYLKVIMIIYGIICISFEIFLISLISIDPSLVVTIYSTFNSKYTIYPYIFMIFGIITFIITGILFTRNSLKSNDGRIRWKGKFLLAAFICFTIGAVFDAGINMDIITLVVVRSILIVSSILYYLGFLLPDWLAKILVKDK